MFKNQISRQSPWIFLSVFVLIAGFLMINASKEDAATMDELAHIPAGYSYVRFQDFRLNPEHPPLLKALSGAFLLPLSPNFPTESVAWQTDVNGQWDAGRLFLYESGNDADEILFWSRLGPILLTLLLILLTYIWARKLVGPWWALLPSLFLAFSPTLLAHGHYVTTDVAAALGALIALWSFSNYLEMPSSKKLIIAGVCLALAQLLKFSSVLFFPLFVLLLIIAFQNREKLKGLGQNFASRFISRLKALVASLLAAFGMFIVSFVVIYSVYFVFTLNYPIERQVSDTKATLMSFAGGPDENLETCKLSSQMSFLRRMRCLAEIDIRMAENRLLRPLGQYFLGVLMVTQRSTGGNTGYFMGEVAVGGWLSYFPTLFATKETLPSLIFIAMGLGLALIVFIKKFFMAPTKIFKRMWRSASDYLDANLAEFCMIAYIILYWLYSLRSPLNIGIRHILPTLPFLYILITGIWKKFGLSGFNFRETMGVVKQSLAALLGTLKKSAAFAAIIFLAVWQMVEAAGTYPYFLSYYNVLGGGTANGYRIATDSNYDWGQDLKRLKEFVDENDIKKIGVDYFGGGNPKYYLGDKEENWWSARGNPIYEKSAEPIEWLAVSINTIQIAKGKLAPGMTRDPETEYSWLTDPYKPYARAGKSIFIYKFND